MLRQYVADGGKLNHLQHLCLVVEGRWHQSLRRWNAFEKRVAMTRSRICVC